MATILIVQSRVDGTWNYGPEALRKVLQHDDAPGWATAEEAELAARGDVTVPRDACFVREAATEAQEPQQRVEPASAESIVAGLIDSLETIAMGNTDPDTMVNIAMDAIDDAKRLRLMLATQGRG